jgi:hypothetical protein
MSGPPAIPDGWPVLEVPAHRRDLSEDAQGAAYRGYAVQHGTSTKYWPGTVECSLAVPPTQDAALQAARLTIGQEVVLRRDYDNPYDADAVMVLDCDGQHHVGYLPPSAAHAARSWSSPRGLVLGLFRSNGARVGCLLLIANEPLRLRVAEPG